MNRITAVINGQEVSIAFDENSIHIYNAFPIKDELKQRGYRWNPTDKSWFCKPPDLEAELNRLQNNGTSVPPVKKPSPTLDIKPIIPSYLPESLSVADLRNRLDQLIREGIRGNVWVRGVIASAVKNYTWASYLDLKDEDESRDIFFRVEVKKDYLERITRKLLDSGVAAGLEKDLPVFCNVEVHLPVRNVVDIRLTLWDILPEYTQSKIRNQREITLEKLKAEGILENQKQLLMPALISRIGLITSGQGTSITDIQAGLFPYAGRYSFYFVDSRMEGANAVDTILQALAFLEERFGNQLDAIIIARGGGSEQSLSVFNDLRLCRAVCLASIPIITAIGHEKDLSAIECCSWLTPTPATPSGIGKYLQNRFLVLQEQLAKTIKQLIHYFTALHGQEMAHLKAQIKHIPARLQATLLVHQERLRTLTQGVEQAMAFCVRDHQRSLITQTAHLFRRLAELRKSKRQALTTQTTSLYTLVQVKSRRALKEVEKTIGRLDFAKRQRDNLKQGEELLQKSRALFSLALKTLVYTQKTVLARQQFVQAADPLHILKKGFTLTLDQDHRVITSLQAFQQYEGAPAVLRFYDGSTEIMKYNRTLPGEIAPLCGGDTVEAVKE